MPRAADLATTKKLETALETQDEAKETVPWFLVPFIRAPGMNLDLPCWMGW
jgi:hypothetical protein